MTTCERCNGVGYLSVRNGDDDSQCPICSNLSEPVIVSMGGYTANVQEIRGFYHLTLYLMGEERSLVNLFFEDHHAVLAMGRALVMACRPTYPAKRIGWSFDVSKRNFDGWIEFRGREPQTLPSVVGQASGHELGRALLQLGLMMDMRRKMALWLGSISEPKSKAG